MVEKDVPKVRQERSLFECVSTEKLKLAQLAATASQAQPIIALDPQIVVLQADPCSQPRRAFHRRTPNTKIDRRDCVAYAHSLQVNASIFASTEAPRPRRRSSEAASTPRVERWSGRFRSSSSPCAAAPSV